MQIILSAHSSNEFFNGNCDYAVVELTPALAKQIRNRVALARKAGQKDRDLYEMYFWGGTAEFYGCALLEACQEAVAAASGSDEAANDWLTELEQREYAVVPDGVDFNAHETQRTECDQMVVRCNRCSDSPTFSVAWTASPKHADLEITTSELPLAAMDELLAARRPSAA